MRLEVSRKSDLAVRALRALAAGDSQLKGPALAEQVGSTAGFVSQVLAPLVRAGWVRSEPGPNGGYRLAVPLSSLSILDVVEAVEGPTDGGRCVLADRPCDERGPCALHVPWVRARELLLRELDATPLTVTSAVEVTGP